MGCATSLVKYIVFLFNLIFALAGLALITIGVIFKLHIEDFQAVIESKVGYLTLAPTILIAVGAVVFVIAFFGCCGAVREGTCCLTTYAVILLSIFIIQVAIAVFAFLQFKDDTSQIKSTLRTEMYNSLSLYNTQTATREAFNAMQAQLGCCGVLGPSDWQTTWGNGSAPASCCSEPVNYICSISNSHERGCLDTLWSWLKSQDHILAYVVIGIATAEIIGAIFALCLVSSIRNAYRRSNYA